MLSFFDFAREMTLFSVAFRLVLAVVCGGVIGIVKDGDMIEIDIPANKIELLISDEELSAEYIIPAPFDPRVGKTVAKAVYDCAVETGITTCKQNLFASFTQLSATSISV